MKHIKYEIYIYIYINTRKIEYIIYDYRRSIFNKVGRSMYLIINNVRKEIFYEKHME